MERFLDCPQTEFGQFQKLRAADRYEAAFDRLVATMADRIMPIDEPVAKLWGKLLGERDKNRFDTCLAATALVHSMVVATRNTIDFRGRRVRLLDPFTGHPRIVEAEA